MINNPYSTIFNPEVHSFSDRYVTIFYRISLFAWLFCPYLGVPAVSEVAELPAQVVVEVGGDGLRLRVSGGLGRPLAVVTVSVVAEAVGVSVVAVALQVTIPIAVARVPANEAC